MAIERDPYDTTSGTNAGLGNTGMRDAGMSANATGSSVDRSAYDDTAVAPRRGNFWGWGIGALVVLLALFALFNWSNHGRDVNSTASTTTTSRPAGAGTTGSTGSVAAPSSGAGAGTAAPASPAAPAR
jgi:hypothetical protein